MLILPIKKKWFDMIASGEKKEEYREIKPYYDSRFMNAFGFLLVGGQMVYGEAAPEEIRKPWPVPVVLEMDTRRIHRKLFANVPCNLEKASRSGVRNSANCTMC